MAAIFSIRSMRNLRKDDSQTKFTFPFHKEFLPMWADQRFGKERCKINHNFSQQWTHWSKGHLQLLSEWSFTWRCRYSQMFNKRFNGQFIRSGLSWSRTQAVRNSYHRDLPHWLLSSLCIPKATLHIALSINHTTCKTWERIPIASAFPYTYNEHSSC